LQHPYIHWHKQFIVEYMKVPENGDDAYLKMETELWKPMHKKLVKDQKLLYWGLYAIPYPGGTGSEYQYATVRVFKDMAQSGEDFDFAKLFKEVHPTMDVNKALSRTLETRDLVRRMRLSSWERFMNENGPTPKIMTVVSMNVKQGKTAEYQAVERNLWQPMHKMEMKNQKREGWEGLTVDMPWGSKNPFNYVTVDFYKDWAQYTKQLPASAYEQVSGGKTFQEIVKATNEVVEVYLSEEWHLITDTNNEL
jgi:hypothetical protein